jgi:hypothetical protein
VCTCVWVWVWCVGTCVCIGETNGPSKKWMQKPSHVSRRAQKKEKNLTQKTVPHNTQQCVRERKEEATKNARATLLAARSKRIASTVLAGDVMHVLLVSTHDGMPPRLPVRTTDGVLARMTVQCCNRWNRFCPFAVLLFFFFKVRTHVRFTASAK